MSHSKTKQTPKTEQVIPASKQPPVKKIQADSDPVPPISGGGPDSYEEE